METLKKNSVVTGHHVYKSIWTPFIGEMLPDEIKDIHCIVNERRQNDRTHAAFDLKSFKAFFKVWR